MSLLEWLGESYDPGPTGCVKGHDRRQPQNRGTALFLGIVSLGVAAFPLVMIFLHTPGETWSLYLPAAILGEFFYITLGYLVRPEPDTSNMGWCGGLMDNPFRYSDDINRMLLFFKIILYPGRLLCTGLLDMIDAIRR